MRDTAIVTTKRNIEAHDILGDVTAVSGSLAIRDASTDDIGGVAALVATCGPYLSKHGDYLYFLYSHCFGKTCAVAVEDGKIVGWRSALQVSAGNYFLHQLGVVPEARGKHVAFRLFAHLLCKLRARHGENFRLEFTADRKNEAVHRLNRKVAEAFHMRLTKLSEDVPQLEEGSEEELYEMTPVIAQSASSPANGEIGRFAPTFVNADFGEIAHIQADGFGTEGGFHDVERIWRQRQQQN